MQQPVITTVPTSDSHRVIALLQELAQLEGHHCSLTPQALVRQQHAPQARLIVLGAYSESVLIGCVCAYAGYDVLSATSGYHVSDLIITASHRRGGIGRALMGALSDMALQHGFRWMSWTRTPANHGAQLFYEACGAVQPDATFMAMGHSAMQALAEHSGSSYTKY